MPEPGWIARHILRPDLVRAAALLAIPGVAVVLAHHLLARTVVGLTAGDGSFAFGDDTINFWAAARLVLEGRAAEIYDFARFHVFQEAVLGGPIHLYHYSYPPTALLVTFPLGLFPYLGGWVVWLLGGWLAFALTLRAAWPASNRRRRDALLAALALPAVLVNAMAGQNGTWLAAVIGGGLMILPHRPVLAGMLLGILTVKPQLALLVPVALLAGRHWSAFLAFAATAAALALASALLLGAGLWQDYLVQAGELRRSILEAGDGGWRPMTSVFAMLRSLGVPVAVAYAVQGAAALAALLMVVRAWRRPGPQPVKNALLVLGALCATPYLQVYDLVMASFVPVWLMAGLPPEDPRRAEVMAGSALLVLAPLASPVVVAVTGVSIGCLSFGPALRLGWRRSGDGGGRGVVVISDRYR